MAGGEDAARVTRAGFKRQEQRAADEARLAVRNRRRQERAEAGANVGVGGAAGGSSTAAGSARFESAGRTHPPRSTAFEGARSMGPSRDIFKCAVFSRGRAVARPSSCRSVNMTCVICGHVAGMTKNGRGFSRTGRVRTHGCLSTTSWSVYRPRRSCVDSRTKGFG